MSETMAPPRAEGARPAVPTEAGPAAGAVAPASLRLAPGAETPDRALMPLTRGRRGAALPDFPAIALLDAPRPRTRGPMLFGLLIFLVFVVGFGTWSALAPLAEAAIAPGVIKVEGTRRTIQHLEGGIVREILVRDGARVTAGQPLMRLDGMQADTQLETVRAQRWTLMAQDARLDAEQNRAREVSFPAELLGSGDPRAADAITGQRTLFEARRASLTSQTAALQARIEQARAQIAGADGQVRAARQQLEFIRQELAGKRELLRQGLSRLSEVLALERAQAGIQGQIEQLLGEAERARGLMAESTQQIRLVEDQRQQEVSGELREVRGKLAESEERLRAATDVMTRRDILAPEAGTIVDLKVFTLGAVVRPGDPIMDLVPEGDRLVAEVHVQPMDIDVVYPGLRSEVRLPAFKQRLVPFLDGEVTFVAADITTNPQTQQQYYRAQILIDRAQLARLENVSLTPGMPVEAHVQIGQRTFWRYITQPVRDSFHRAFREQ